MEVPMHWGGQGTARKGLSRDVISLSILLMAAAAHREHTAGRRHASMDGMQAKMAWASIHLLLLAWLNKRKGEATWHNTACRGMAQHLQATLSGRQRKRKLPVHILQELHRHLAHTFRNPSSLNIVPKLHSIHEETALHMSTCIYSCAT
jgi:hypothetical protein